MLVSRMNVELYGYEPEIVIFQIGLCDCAPRALTELELRIVQKLPIINRLIHLFIKRYYAQISARRGIAYTNKKTFKTNIQNIIDNFKNSKIYFIPIGKPYLGTISKKSPEINERIRCYNDLLLELANQNKCKYLNNLINSNDNRIEDIYCEDFHHLNFIEHLELSQRKLN